MIPGDDPQELKPTTRRFQVSNKPSMPGLKGGQGHSGADLDEAADCLIPLILAGLVIITIAALRA